VGLLYESENLDTAVPFYVNIKVLQNMGKVRYRNEKAFDSSPDSRNDVDTDGRLWE
jgi:hypothetical protein